VHFAQWTQAAIDAGDRVQVRSVDEVRARVAEGLITGPGGGPFQSAGFVVNCPLISIDVP
ncbi:MAG: hypothetical protein QOE27_1346, partial [Solirubrobacteraceae bacterium]|nr:hypothetical protein [Solirubrobacteraceae bacterium]